MKKQLLVVLCSLLALYSGAQVCLWPATTFSGGYQGYTMCKADFNNDGKMDLATGNIGSLSVTVFLGNGSGGFSNGTDANINNHTYGICAADFNADGKQDLAMAIRDSNRVSVIYGDGLGGFSATPDTFGVGLAPYAIFAADFNKDGRMDLVTANSGSNDITVLQAVGSGGFTVACTPATGISTSPYSVYSDDFNNDGLPDIVAANYSTSTITLFLGNGTCSYSSSTLYSCGNHPTQIVAGDINGDGYKDLVTANYLGNNASVLINNNGTGFNTASNFTAGSNPQSVCVTDLSADGKPDVVIANGAGGANNVSVLVNTTPTNSMTATFSPKVNYAVNASNPFFIVDHDYDSNGRNDLATVDFLSANISILLNGAPNASISGNLDICSASGGTSLMAASATTYTWSGGLGNSQYIYPNPPVGTTSYTLTEANGTCTATAVATITVTATPTITVIGNLNICSGVSTTLTAGTATTYTWSSNAGSATTETVSVNPNTTTTYTVNGQNGNCYSQAYATVNVTATPTVVISGNMAICSGQNTTLTGSSAGSYTWSSGGGSQSEMVSPSTTATYTLTEANGVCTGSNVATVSVTPTPTVSISNAANLCLGSSTLLTASGATNYTWSANAANAVTSTVSVNPTTAAVYTITGGDALLGGSGQCTSTATTSVNVVIPTVPSICMVTVDSLSLNNLIIWDKTPYATADTFIVYRDTANNNYTRIGKVAKSALSQYIDTARHIGAVNGDPNITTYRYKISYIDTCGNESPMSPFHNTIYQYNTGSLFLWNQYQIEGQTSPVPGLSSYVLRRDNVGGTGNYITAATAGASSTSINDPQYSTYATTADWRVETVWSISCQPTYFTGNNSSQAAIIKSKSNISNNRTTAIKKVENNFVVYPNPTSGNVTVILLNGLNKANIKIVSILGTEVYNENVNAGTDKLNVDLSKCESGIYLVQVTTASGSTVKRIVKN